jgi:hypothetical protein
MNDMRLAFVGSVAPVAAERPGSHSVDCSLSCRRADGVCSRTQRSAASSGTLDRTGACQAARVIDA